MVRIIVDLSGDCFDGLNGLVSSGKYKDISQAIEVAAQNQLQLEREGFAPYHTEQATVRIPTNKKDQPQTTKVARMGAQEDYLELIRDPIGMPGVLQSPSESMLVKGSTPGELEAFMWGQYNRIFPAKVGLRVLDNLISNSASSTDSNMTTDYFKYITTSSNVARDIGIFVRDLDDRLGRKRSERFSNGLPIGAEEAKSLSRYMNHFLARRRKNDGTLEGFLARLRMVNLVLDKDQNILGIGLTKAGLDFSRLENDLLLRKDAGAPLSLNEIEYYTAHVLRNVPEERTALGTLLGIIDGGLVHTKDIDEMLKAGPGKNWTPAMIVTNRAGTLSRLWELGLVKRIEDGIPEYRITESGRGFLMAIRAEMGLN